MDALSPRPRPRSSRRPSPLTTAGLAALLAALLTALLAAVPAPVQAAGPSQDYPTMPRQCATRAEKIPQDPIVCRLTPKRAAKPTLVLWGDSHAWMFIPALRKLVKGTGINLVAVLSGSCPPMDNQVEPNDAAPDCYRSNAMALQFVRGLERGGKPYRVVLGSSWQRYLHALKVGDRESYVGQNARVMRTALPRLVRDLRMIGAPVDVIGQAPTVPERHPRCRAGNDPYACNLQRAKSLPEAASTKAYLQRTFKTVLKGRKLIDVTPAVCGPKLCRGKVDGVRTWFDDLHLSATRTSNMRSYFAKTLDGLRPRGSGRMSVQSVSAESTTSTGTGSGCVLFSVLPLPASLC